MSSSIQSSSIHTVINTSHHQKWCFPFTSLEHDAHYIIRHAVQLLWVPQRNGGDFSSNDALLFAGTNFEWFYETRTMTFHELLQACGNHGHCVKAQLSSLLVACTEAGRYDMSLTTGQSISTFLLTGQAYCIRSFIRMWTDRAHTVIPVIGDKHENSSEIKIFAACTAEPAT